MDDRGIPSHYLKELWQCVANEKSDPLRRLEAQVGLDPEGRSAFLDSFGETPDLRVSGAISQNEEIKILLRAAAHPKSLRFEKARLLGDLLLFQNQKISMVTTGLEFRQKAQRAFAAELLVPTEALNKNLPASGEFDDDAVFRLADEYDVSQVCVVHQIRNRKLPYRSQLSD